MKKRKVYVTKNMDLSHAVIVKGSRVRIHFTGSNPSPKRNGTLITEDEALQKAIEEDSSYGVLFELESVTELPDKNKKTSASVGTTTTSTAETTTVVAENTVKEETTVEDEELEEVTNFNKAREYLRTKHSVQMGQMQNTIAVVAVAKELGIVFPNWTPAIA